MPKFNKWLSTLLRNKEKLEEIAITTVNAECSAIILNKVPEKLEDPGKFLIPCALQELDRTNALADSGASINLLPHSIYKQLGLGALKPTRMTLELANRSVTHPMGIAEDVVVRVDGFTFLADFVVVNFEPDPRVPIILGRPFLRTAKALIDLYEEKLTLRVGNDELVFYADKSEKNKNKKFAHAISIIDFSKDEQFSGSTTIHSDALLPSSSPVKTSDNLLEEFADEFTLPNPFPPGNDDSILKKDVHEENFQIYSNPLFEFNFNSSNENPLFNEMEEDVEYFALGDNNDEIDAFLAMEVSSNFEEGYFDSEGDVTFLDNLLSDDASHNVASEYLYPRLRIVSPLKEGNRYFLVPDDLIPPGVENDDSEDEDNELPNLDHQDDPSIPRPPPEPPDVEKCFEPEAGILIIKVFKGVSKSHDFMTNILPTLPTLVSDLTFILFLSSFLSFGSEDTIFDPGIITFPFSYLDPVAFSMKVSCSKIDPTISEDSRVRCCTDKTKITRNPSKNGKTRTRERKSMQEPEAKIKKSTLDDNSSGQEHPGKVKTSLKLILANSTRMHVDSKKAQGVLWVLHSATTQSNKVITSRNMQAGNPCVHICNPTAMINLAMIGGMDGRDCQELRADMTEKDVEALHARARRQRAEALQISLRFAQMDITDLLESRGANRLEMAELQSRALDIEASLWEIEMCLGP
ncbi:reverse transcriptase domain-containing protein [Tanacetum coccineum]